jgi:signal transduction histidine kinase
VTSDSPSIVRRSVIRYLALSAAVLVVIGAVTTAFASRLAVDEEVHEARNQTRAMADRIASPLVDRAVREGDSEALALLDRVLENRMRDGSVTHIVVYSEDGLVLWSDTEEIRRQRVPFEDDVAALLGTRNTAIHEPGEGNHHPWSEPGDGDLIEVYAGARDVDGVPFVFEAYLSPDVIEENRADLFKGLLPIVLGMILLFMVATLPLAIDLARRVDRAAANRSTLLRASLRALQDERRRVAQILHDGVIQDLAAAGYALSTLTDRTSADAPLDDRARESTGRVEELIRDDLRQLRSLVGDLFPSDLAGENLTAALGALRSRAAERYGLHVTLDLEGLDGLDDTTSGAVYNVVREALNNVGNHAKAATAEVSVHRDVDGVAVTVTDDGVGLSGAEILEEPDGPREHLGLRLLSRQLEELGGWGRLADGTDGGAVLTAWIPFDQAP